MRTEEIYEALFDEDAFQRLPGRFARMLNAKSAIINWTHQDGETVNLAYYNFSPAMMAEYAANFVQKDPWIAESMRSVHHNRIFNASEHVSSKVFERTELYNELLRPFGDDTFHCVGGAFVNEHGSGVLGINRGRRQASFGETEKKMLEGHAVALRRVLLMRGEIASHRRNAQLAKSALDVTGLAAIVTNGDLRILHANALGETVLNRRDGLFSRNGMMAALHPDCNARLAAAAGGATRTSERTTGVAVVSRRGHGEAYRLTVSPLPGPGRARCLHLFRDPEMKEQGLRERVMRMFGLTAAEADLAVALSEGLNLKDIVDRRAVRESTVRSQIKALAAKMHCSRQAEIAAIIARLPPLKGDGGR